MDYERSNALEWQQVNPDGSRYQHEDSDSEYASEDDILVGGPRPSSFQPVRTSRPVLGNTATAISQSLGTSTRAAPKTAKLDGSRQPIGQPHVRRLQYKKDTHAEARWRSGRPADGFFDLPAPYLDLAPSLQQAAGLPKLSTDNIDDPIRAIAARTRTFIECPGPKDQKLSIWATHKSFVEAAQRQLAAWINPPRQVLASPQNQKAQPQSNNRGPKTKMIPSVHPQTQKDLVRIEKALHDKRKKETYRQDPGPREIFAYTGIFPWPLSEIRPELFFGVNFAALDPLRMWLDCFITYDSQSSIFKILLNDRDEVELSDGARRLHEGVNRLRTALCECATRGSTPFEIYLADLAPSRLATKETKIIDVSALSSNNADGSFVAGTGSRPGLYRHVLEMTGMPVAEKDRIEWEANRKKRNEFNGKVMKQTVRRALDRLVYFRGRVQMKAHIGSFIFTRHFWTQRADRMPIEEVLKHLQDPNTRGEMQQRLPAAQDANNIFRRTSSATNLLEPMDSMTEHLKDVKPVYIATFHFPLTNTEWLKLQVEAHSVSVSGDWYEISDRQWTRHDSSTRDPLQIFMVPFKRSITWGLNVTADYVVDQSKMNIDRMEFAKAVQLLTPSGHASPKGATELMFNFSREGVQHFQQKTAWRYRLKANGGYVLEIARYDTFDLKGKYGTLKPNERKPKTTHWGGSFWNEIWDEKLSTNSSLQIGEKAQWDPSLDSFFPKNFRNQSTTPEVGFDDFVRNVQSVVNILNEPAANEAQSNGSPNGFRL